MKLFAMPIKHDVTKEEIVKLRDMEYRELKA